MSIIVARPRNCRPSLARACAEPQLAPTSHGTSQAQRCWGKTSLAPERGRSQADAIPGYQQSQ